MTTLAVKTIWCRPMQPFVAARTDHRRQRGSGLDGRGRAAHGGQAGGPLLSPITPVAERAFVDWTDALRRLCAAGLEDGSGRLRPRAGQVRRVATGGERGRPAGLRLAVGLRPLPHGPGAEPGSHLRVLDAD